MSQVIRGILISVVLLISTNLSAASIVNHELMVELLPSTHRIKVIDTVTLSPELLKIAKERGLQFYLHKGEKIALQTKNLTLTSLAVSADEAGQFSVTVEKHELKGEFSKDSFTVEYERDFVYQLEEVKQGLADTTGLIDDIGVYLANESMWYPRISDEYVTFTLTVKQPKEWSSVSQGERIYQEKAEDYRVDTWQEMSPQDNLYLIAAKFFESETKAGDVKIYAFLRKQDEGLARRYMDATSQYLSMYEQLLGKFPYKKFALVENFWETGYGMPSFTLLGEKVIRLPFILQSSYPHELVHNWWGNSVYVDYEKGNWSEGLTTYLSDHLLQEQQGQGAEYRRGVLQKYTNFTQSGNDFALENFQFRHSDTTEAVGYGKTMMLFHMLRKNLGDKLFKEGLQEFYKQYQFKKATFADIESIYTQLAHTDLHDFFSQWIERVGAPSIAIGDAVVGTRDGMYTLSMEIVQQQDEAPYALFIPAAITFEGQKFTEIRMLGLQERINKIELIFPYRPLRIDVDPYFDVFRKLDPQESSPALSKVFGDEKIMMILPSNDSRENREAYLYMAESWKSQRYPQIEIVEDSQLKRLPADMAVVILGLSNKFLTNFIATNTSASLKFSERSFEVSDEQYSVDKTSLVSIVDRSAESEHGLALISLHNPKAVEGLIKKVPHYGKYSYLLFEGEEPENVGKGQWPAANSPLSRQLGKDVVPSGIIPSFPALVNSR